MQDQTWSVLLREGLLACILSTDIYRVKEQIHSQTVDLKSLNLIRESLKRGEHGRPGTPVSKDVDLTVPHCAWWPGGVGADLNIAFGWWDGQMQVMALLCKNLVIGCSVWPQDLETDSDHLCFPRSLPFWRPLAFMAGRRCLAWLWPGVFPQRPCYMCHVRWWALTWAPHFQSLP